MFPWLTIAYHKIVTIHPFTENTQFFRNYSCLISFSCNCNMDSTRYLNLWILALSKHMLVVKIWLLNITSLDDCSTRSTPICLLNYIFSIQLLWQTAGDNLKKKKFTIIDSSVINGDCYNCAVIISVSLILAKSTSHSPLSLLTIG